MARAKKRFKEYERWVLIGLVVVLLATFSVTGAVRGCEKTPTQEDFGGSYEPTPGQRAEVSDLDFRSVLNRYTPFLMTEGWGPSVKFGSELAHQDREERQRSEFATWQHIAAVGAAEAAGYRVGAEELQEAVKEMVVRGAARRMNVDPALQGVRFSRELYEQVVQRLYRGTKADFERTVREIVLKDKYLAPIVEAQRFTADPSETYERWKSSRERVDLQYAAVPASAFQAGVDATEATRTAIGTVNAKLQSVVASVLQVRRVTDVAGQWKAQNGDQWPADAADLLAKEPGRRSLAGKMPVDGWGKTLVYAKTADGAQVSSVGPDGQAGTPDDLGLPIVEAVTTLGALHRTGDALMSWRKTAGAWPATLAELTRPPPAVEGKPAQPAFLVEVPKDAWGRELVWEPAGPALVSSGADGQRGTSDDVSAEIVESTIRIPAPASILAFAGDVGKDAWGKDLRVVLRSANPITLGAVSAGPDGVPANADDVVTGNTNDLQSYFNFVKPEFRLSLRREFEALYVIPALVPDEIFAEAWKRFPEHRPDDKEAWDLFRGTGGGFYQYEEEEAKDKEAKTRVTIDAADPKKGYAAALLEDLRAKGVLPKDATGWQVPSADTFGDRKDPAAPTAGGLPSPESDALYKTYLEKGWRRVVLRDQFFEKVLDSIHKASRAGAAAVKAWEEKGSKGEKPTFESFSARLAAWKDLQPGEADAARGARFIQYFSTKPGEPLAREDLEKLPDLGDYMLSTSLSLQDDEYGSIPSLLRGGALRAALHSVKRHEPRDAELSEVREKLWPRYLAHQAMARAAEVLSDVHTGLEASWTAAGAAATPEARVADFKRLVGEAAAKGGWPVHLERTGLFVGSAVAPTRESPAGATPEEKAASLRRAYVRRYGYDQVKVAGSAHGKSVEVGQLGRTVLRDAETGEDATHCAYLVGVAAHAFPTPEEFHGGEYLRTVAEQAYDLPEWYAPLPNPTSAPKTMVDVLRRLYDDWEDARKTYAIQTVRTYERTKD